MFCPIGWKRSTTDLDLTRCQQCEEGKTTRIRGEASCTSCDLGTFGNTTNANRKCSACPVGQYQDERKQLKCKQCIDGKIPNPQQTSCELPEWKTPNDCDNTQYLNQSHPNQIQHDCVSAHSFFVRGSLQLFLHHTLTNYLFFDHFSLSNNTGTVSTGCLLRRTRGLG